MEIPFILVVLFACRAIAVLMRLVNGASFEFACELRRGERSAWMLGCTGAIILMMVHSDATWEWVSVLILVIVSMKTIWDDLNPTHVFPRRIISARVLGRIVRAALLEPPVKPPPTKPDTKSESN
jgi:hypothetical protein